MDSTTGTSAKCKNKPTCSNYGDQVHYNGYCASCFKLIPFSNFYFGMYSKNENENKDKIKQRGASLILITQEYRLPGAEKDVKNYR